MTWLAASVLQRATSPSGEVGRVDLVGLAVGTLSVAMYQWLMRDITISQEAAEAAASGR